MGLIREPEGVDFVIEPHEVTEKDHLAMLAFIEACKSNNAERNRQVTRLKRSFKRILVEV